jgi:hypothetical protein
MLIHADPDPHRSRQKICVNIWDRTEDLLRLTKDCSGDPPRPLHFHFDADPDPAFHLNADPNPASKNDTDPCGS